MTADGGAPYPGDVGRWLTHSSAALAAVVLFAAGCAADPPAGRTAAPARLPAGTAGAILQRGLDAAGGWERWQRARDVSFISMVTVTDQTRDVATDSIGWFTAPLHGGALARMDSIGLPTEVRFGIDAARTWILSQGKPVLAPGQLAVSRFELVSSLFWFSLPFRLAEAGVDVTDAGDERGPDGVRWHRLRATFSAGDPAVPGRWVVVYFDAATGLIDRVHAELSAPFLRHPVWIGHWRGYRDCGGLMKERQRQFFPADAAGRIIGAMVAEQFIEHVQFDNGYPPGRFRAPADAAAQTAAAGRPRRGAS